MPQVSPGLQRATTELSGQVFVVADRDSNSLLITTASKYLERVRAIVEELDRPVPQVLIKVLIVEVTHDDSSDIGADFSILNKRANGNGQSAITNFGNAAAQSVSGGLAVSIMETNFAATLHLLQTQGKLDVLSRPYILASDNQQATITVGQEVPFITNSQITELGGVNNTVRYDDIGIILDVTPHINPDGLVILDVSPEISQLTGTSIPIGNSVNSPVIAKRSADSRVGVKNGQTVVIGGLMEDRKTLTVNKVPILGDLPFLGPAFSRTETAKTKTELLIFLTPHVAAEPDGLQPMSQDEVRGTKLAPNAVEPGTFQHQIEGLHRGHTDLTTQPATKAINPAARVFTETAPAEVPTPPRPPEDGNAVPTTRPATGPAARDRPTD
jgi:general secretion pathway protein D